MTRWMRWQAAGAAARGLLVAGVTLLGLGVTLMGLGATLATDALATDRRNPVMENTLAAGDRVKLTFFEKVEGAEGQPTSYFERVELTGEYVVQLDGSLFLPLLGPTPVAGRPFTEAADTMAAAFRDVFGREARIGLALVDRDPVYVIGPVPRPGSFRFTPGMTVAHALALAGGLERQPGEASHYIEVMRVTETLQRSSERLKRMLARRTALEAEITQAAPAVPDALRELAGDQQSEALIAEAASISRLAVASQRTRLDALQDAVDAAKRELPTLQARAALIEAEIKTRGKRLGILHAMQERGVTGGFSYYQAHGEMTDIQERQQAALAAITQVEQKINQAEHERRRVETEIRLNIERELAATANDIAQENVTMANAAQVLRSIGMPSPGASSRQKATFRVVRRTARGNDEQIGQDTSLLQPGDLVVVRLPVEAAAVSAVGGF